MIEFVNAKLNIGLHIVRRRADGYHELQTLFYPVGRFNGTPECPSPFCDILEVGLADADDFHFTGRKVDCEVEQNLAIRAVRLFSERYRQNVGVSLTLEKHLPDGAGLGGGSADASFVLRMLNALTDYPFTDAQLSDMALQLGADCPFFIGNVPAYGEGVGELLTPHPEVLKGYWCVIVKPDIYVSTREAFAGITPDDSRAPLDELLSLPIDEWRQRIFNDFERSLFPQYPRLGEIKEQLYENGAVYASMSGSGSSLYGLFRNRKDAESAVENARFADCYRAICLL